MYLLRAVEQHLRRTGTSPTRFGREAVGDPRFVVDLCNGREPRERTEERVRAYLRAVEERQSSAAGG